ncbi:MAG TPA: APC family permease [Ktedonobacteraceae bacterium]|nr:APC family permease [Ktedonobacteraceae bacterium]
MMRREIVSPSQKGHEEQSQDRVLRSERYALLAMPAQLGKADMTIFFIMALFLLTNAVSGAAGGPVSLLYLGLGALVFFFPCVVVTLQLGIMLPHEGSLYNWTTKALSPFWGFFIGLCYWLTGVLAVITAGSVFVTTLQGLNNGWLDQPWQQGLTILGLLTFVGIVALQRQRAIQNFINLVFVLTLLSVVLIGLAAVVWLATGHTPQTNFSDPTGWTINSGNYFLFAIITLNFVGANGPLTLGGEILGSGTGTRQFVRIVKSHLLIGTPIVILLYTIVTLSVLIVRGANILQAPVLPFEAFTAVGMTLGHYAEGIAVVCFLCYAQAAMVFYSILSTRLLFVAGVDQLIPSRFGRLNKNRVPGFSTIFQLIFTAIVVVLVFVVTPTIAGYFGNAGATTSQQLYTVVAAATTLVWTIATLFTFIDLVFLYFRQRANFLKNLQFPLWVIWLSVVVGGTACLLTIVGILLYSWIPLISNDTWWMYVGGLSVALLTVAAVLSALANSEAVWESMVN